MEIIIEDNALKESLKRYMNRNYCFLRTYYVLKRPINNNDLTKVIQKTYTLPKHIKEKIPKAYIYSKGVEKKIIIPYSKHTHRNEVALGTPILIPAATYEGHISFTGDVYWAMENTNFIALKWEDKQISPEQAKEYMEKLEDKEAYREYIEFLINQLKTYKESNGRPIDPEILSCSKIIEIKEWSGENIVEKEEIEKPSTPENITSEKRIQEQEPSSALTLISEIRTLLSTYTKETRDSYEKSLQEILQTTTYERTAGINDLELIGKLSKLLAEIKFIEKPKVENQGDYINKYLTSMLENIEKKDSIDTLDKELAFFYHLVNKMQSQEEVPNLAEYDALHKKATTILSTLLIKFPEQQEQILTALSTDFEQSIRLEMQSILENDLSLGINPIEIYPLLTEKGKNNKEFITEASKILQKNNHSRRNNP